MYTIIIVCMCTAYLCVCTCVQMHVQAMTNVVGQVTTLWNQCSPFIFYIGPVVQTQVTRIIANAFNTEQSHQPSFNIEETVWLWLSFM